MKVIQLILTEKQTKKRIKVRMKAEDKKLMLGILTQERKYSKMSEAVKKKKLIECKARIFTYRDMVEAKGEVRHETLKKNIKWFKLLSKDKCYDKSKKAFIEMILSIWIKELEKELKP